MADIEAGYDATLAAAKAMLEAGDKLAAEFAAAKLASEKVFGDFDITHEKIKKCIAVGSPVVQAVCQRMVERESRQDVEDMRKAINAAQGAPKAKQPRQRRYV